MNALGEHLRHLIAREGPISVAEYMRLCLSHPEHGYYMKADPLGRAGDFITAPEISQMFGELIGLWSLAVWQAMALPGPVRLVELGPGRGTLMTDALRAANQMPAFTGADVHLVETSPVLRQRQKQSLQSMAPQWHDSIADVPEGPAVFIANEFFDALPIRQYQRSSDGWHERHIGVDGEGTLQFQLAMAQPLSPELPAVHASAAPGAVIEFCTAGVQIIRAIAEHVCAHGGAALIVDYGYADHALGDTFQAVKEHAYADPLADPGDADLTAHVDFSALAEAAQIGGGRAHGPVDQGEFLISLGIRERAAMLSGSGTSGQVEEIGTALERLTASHAMGRLFKAMAVTEPDVVPPPGFADIGA